jgi:hemolysin III
MDQTAHYPRPRERTIDAWIHALGLAAGGIGGVVLLTISLVQHRPGQSVAVAIYGGCLVAMFACSAAYNFAGSRRRPLLRRFDHAAIFLMIAGSYTPFTTQSLTGTWAIAMTAIVWTLALAGAAAKLLLPGLARGFWIGLYLVLGWAALAALKPLFAALSVAALILLAAGGVIYSLGVIVYARRSLPFRRAIWHGFVLAAAGVQYAAVLIGVVLAVRP